MKNNYVYTQNRELSWLKFNERVLEEASDLSVPLAERLKFISIFTSNLDEFYMVRCGSLYDLSLVDAKKIDNKSGMTPKQQLDAIFKQTKRLYEKRDLFYREIHHSLWKMNIQRVDTTSLKKEEEKYLKQYFSNYLLPILSPQVIDLHHPFPHLINKTLQIILSLKHSKEKNSFGILPIPSQLPRIIYLSKEEKLRYILLEDVISMYAYRLFPTYEIKSKTIISVTRNADINLEQNEIDDDEDYRQYMKKILKKRNRLAPIRLEVYRNYDEQIISFLCYQLNIEEKQVFLSQTPLELSYSFDIYEELERRQISSLLYPPYLPKSCVDFTDDPLIPQLLEKDMLLSFPFQSMIPFLQLLREAAFDPNVVSIKMTIYRLSKNSKIIEYLMLAAENGKDVTVLMELRARFDEHNNIDYAELLENNGCHILYGQSNYKVHSKICLITRRNQDQIQYITQVGTGNYNEKTSKLYTDLSYITAREEIGKDAALFFQNMAVGNLQGSYQHLMVAPKDLKQNIIEKIDQEIHKAKSHLPASIIMKMNSLTDRDLIDKFSEASCAGVEIHLIIRGICALIPGVKGYTENIKVKSIVGRYLEHSRIYCFGSDNNASIYISSADFMTRNTEKRVEIACPIYDETQKQRILHMLHVMLNDNVKARELNSKGNYKPIENGNSPLDSQNYFMNEANQTSIQQHVEKEKTNWFQTLYQILHR